MRSTIEIEMSCLLKFCTSNPILPCLLLCSSSSSIFLSFSLYCRSSSRSGWLLLVERVENLRWSHSHIQKKSVDLLFTPKAGIEFFFSLCSPLSLHYTHIFLFLVLSHSLPWLPTLYTYTYCIIKTTPISPFYLWDLGVKS